MKIAVLIVLAVASLIIVFRPYFFQHKILFPSNLLVSSYVPWKYEPLPEYPNGPPNKPMGFDDIRQFFPNRKLTKESLTAGVLPLWNPYIYSGTPFMAAFDTAIFYPLTWIAATLSTVEGWNFLVIIQPILSLVFMYLFLRSMKFKVSTSAFGAFAYAFSGWMIVYWQEILVLEHSFLWLPLALYASNRLWDRSNDRVGFFLLILALGCSIFGGFLQMSIYVYICVMLWNAYRFVTQDKKNRMAATVIISAGVIISLLIASIQIIPSLEAFLLSPRGTQDVSFVFRDFLLPIQYLITLIAPDYWGNPATYNYFFSGGFYFEKMIYIGVIPLMFAIYGMFNKKMNVVKFWTILALVTLSLGFALPTSWLPYYLHIPVLSNSYPTRIFAVSAFSLILLSCYGLESFFTEPNRKRMSYILIGMSILLGAAWSVVTSTWCITHHYTQSISWCYGKICVPWDLIGNIPGIHKNAVLYATVSLRNLIIPTLFVISAWGILFISRLNRKIAFIAICALTAASSFYFAQKYVYFGEQRFVYPDLPVIQEIKKISGYDRVWGYGNAYIDKNIPQQYHWFSTDGYGNLSPKRYAELLSTIINNGKLGGPIRRSDTDLYAASERDSFGTANPYRLRIMSLLGVKYILESKKGDLKDKNTTVNRFPEHSFQLIWENDSWCIWLYKESLPRAIFATRYLVKSSDQQLIDMLYDPSIKLSQTVLLERDPHVTLKMQPSANIQATATIKSYELNSVTISSFSPVDGFVLLTDNYYPGWKATVDGKATEIFRGDYSFKAVFVPKGSHIIRFIYFPLTFKIGLAISVVGIITFFIVAMTVSHWRRSKFL